MDRQDRHLILREAYRHLSILSSLARESVPLPSEGRVGGTDRAINSQESGLVDTLSYDGIDINYFDMLTALSKINDIPLKKREAFYLNVILDMKQKDVAQKMGVSPVTIGQHVTSVCRALEEVYFADR